MKFLNTFLPTKGDFFRKLKEPHTGLFFILNREFICLSCRCCSSTRPIPRNIIPHHWRHPRLLCISRTFAGKCRSAVHRGQQTLHIKLQSARALFYPDLEQQLTLWHNYELCSACDCLQVLKQAKAQNPRIHAVEKHERQELSCMN